MIDDAILGGYLERHGRPPAFEGSDGKSYSVAVYVEDMPNPDGQYSAALLFVRWSDGGDVPTGHLETGYLAHGDSRKTAEEAIRRFSLHDVKTHLDSLIAAKKECPDW